MESKSFEQMLRESCNAPALCKLNALVRKLTGVGLFVVWTRGGEESQQMPVCSDEENLPEFCRLLHAVPQGAQSCVKCHALLAVAAKGRNQITQGRCHGGARVLASPVTVPGLPADAEIVVISSCVFIAPDRKRETQIVRAISRELRLNAEELRCAFDKISSLSNAKLSVVGEMVDTAAATLSEALHGRLIGAEAVLANEARDSGIESRLKEALHASRELPFRHITGADRSTVVDIVKSVVGANPQLQVSVADIARAAQITPNHFSLIFRRQTGMTFSDFLAEKRFERAKDRMRDVTLSIAEVACQSGFSNPNYFAKVFRKLTGKTPSEWRRFNT